MKTVVKTIMLILIGGVCFTSAACHSISSNKALQDQLKTQENQDKQKNSLDQTGPISETITKNMATMINVLGQADDIFTQVWPYIWDDASFKVTNVFRVSKQFLKTRFLEDGKAVKPKLCTGSEVFFRITKTVTSPFGVQVPVGYSMFQRDCMATTYNLLMTWEQSSDGIIQTTFETANYAQGVGLSLKVLGKKITCQFRIQNEQGRLDYLSCQGLGQNKNANEYAEFTKLEFVREAELMVHAAGNRYKSLQEIDRSFDLKVPLAGVIEVVEEMAAAPQLEAKKVAELPKAVPQNSLPTPTLAPAAAKKVSVQTPEEAERLEQLKQNEENLTPEQRDLLKQGIPLENNETATDESVSPNDQEAGVVDPALLN